MAGEIGRERERERPRRARGRACGPVKGASVLCGWHLRERNRERRRETPFGARGHAWHIWLRGA